MADKDGSPGWLADLGVSIHEVLRYCYGGLLVFLVAALVDPKDTKTVIDSLSAPVSILIALALGGAIYAAYRPLIGEPLFLFEEWVHCWLSSTRREKGKGCTCCSDYFLTTWKVSLSLGREAFRTVKNSEIFNQERQRQFYLQHSELHTLYVTFFVLLIAAVFVAIRQPEGRWSRDGPFPL